MRNRTKYSYVSNAPTSLTDPTGYRADFNDGMPSADTSVAVDSHANSPYVKEASTIAFNTPGELPQDSSRIDATLVILPQTLCHLACHGIDYSDHRYANEQELFYLDIGLIAVDLAIPLPPIYSAIRTARVANTVANVANVVAPSSRALGRALEATGRIRPPSSAAHHIVAGSAEAGAPARAVLQRFGVGINDAANGVFLPASRAASNASGAAVHSTVHTRAYYQTVNEVLGQATTRTQVLEALDVLGQGLLRGGL